MLVTNTPLGLAPVADRNPPRALLPKVRLVSWKVTLTPAIGVFAVRVTVKGITALAASGESTVTGEPASTVGFASTTAGAAAAWAPFANAAQQAIAVSNTFKGARRAMLPRCAEGERIESSREFLR